MKEITIAVPDGKKAEWVNGVLTLIDEEVNDNRPVMERIKTFEDACKELAKRAESNEGIALLLVDYESNADNIKTKGTLAYMKLCIIAAALNEGWEPQYTEDEYRYYPWFVFYTQKELDEMDEEDKRDIRVLGRSSYNASARAGVAFSYTGYASSVSSTSLGGRLCFKERALAEYAGKQFADIWIDFLVTL